MPDVVTPASNAPPDWETRTNDLLCPLCSYNLRGLTEGRCPECGFAFTWQELLNAEKNKHPYLFEYGKGKNVSSFWKTYWTTCRPRRFWREVNPAQKVRLFRLLLYWILTTSVAALLSISWSIEPVYNGISRTLSLRACFVPFPQNSDYLKATGKAAAMYGTMIIPKQQLDNYFPPPWSANFWNRMGSMLLRMDRDRTMAFWCGMIFIAWPWLTLLSLMIFRFSMRSAKIRSSHLIRTVIYSCDHGLLMIALALAMLIAEVPRSYADGWIEVMMAIAFMLATGYRLTIAFKRYLRVHLPLATVLTSQLISFLIVFVALVPIADFSRRV